VFILETLEVWVFILWTLEGVVGLQPALSKVDFKKNQTSED
jgi:hypothetical protein